MGINLVSTAIWITNIASLIPYFVYAVVFKHPKLWARYFNQKQLITFSKLCKYVSWLIGIPLFGYIGINIPSLFYSIPLFIVGQLLNFWVYKALGDEGVYYGYELGTIKPKHICGYPFVIHDPQYKGCVMTCIGMFLAVDLTEQSVYLLVPWIIGYFFAMGIENSKNRRIGEY